MHQKGCNGNSVPRSSHSDRLECVKGRIVLLELRWSILLKKKSQNRIKRNALYLEFMKVRNEKDKFSLAQVFLLIYFKEYLHEKIRRHKYIG